jgi:hypothetical protein
LPADLCRQDVMLHRAQTYDNDTKIQDPDCAISFMHFETQPRHRPFRHHVNQIATYFDSLPRCQNVPHWTAAELFVDASSKVCDLALIASARFSFVSHLLRILLFFLLVPTPFRSPTLERAKSPIN